MSTSDTLTKLVGDTQPISFVWSIIDATSMTAEVSFDGTNYVPCTGSMVELESGRWQLNYHPQDRPTSAQDVTYRFTDNEGNSDVIVVTFEGTATDPVIPTVVHTEYGPKRVKTREMEIEQFDPIKLHALGLDKVRKVPGFGDSKFSQGQTPEEYERDH